MCKVYKCFHVLTHNRGVKKTKRESAKRVEKRQLLKFNVDKNRKQSIRQQETMRKNVGENTQKRFDCRKNFLN